MAGYYDNGLKLLQSDKNSYFTNHFSLSEENVRASPHVKHAGNEGWKNISSCDEIVTCGTGCCCQIVDGQWTYSHHDTCNGNATIASIESPDVDVGTHTQNDLRILNTPMLNVFM